MNNRNGRDYMFIGVLVPFVQASLAAEVEGQ